jgi:MFS family permease
VGIAGPAANNAALDLLPERVAAVAGLRGMFQSTGGVLGTAAVPLALSRFANETAGLQTTYFVLSLALLGLIPIIFLIPDTARGRRMAAANELRQVEAGG